MQFLGFVFCILMTLKNRPFKVGHFEHIYMLSMIHEPLGFVMVGRICYYPIHVIFDCSVEHCHWQNRSWRCLRISRWQLNVFLFWLSRGIPIIWAPLCHHHNVLLKGDLLNVTFQSGEQSVAVFWLGMNMNSRTKVHTRVRPLFW